MRKYVNSAYLVRTVEQLNDKTTSAVQINGSTVKLFRTTLVVRQGCLPSPFLFNQFQRLIMSDALEGKFNICGTNITHLRFGDDIELCPT